MAAPSDDPSTLVEWVLVGLAAVGGLIVTAGKRIKRAFSRDRESEIDYEAMARAFFSEKDRTDAVQRDAIVTALHEVKAAIERMIDKQEEVISVVRDSNERTRDRFGEFATQLLMLVKR